MILSSLSPFFLVTLNLSMTFLRCKVFYIIINFLVPFSIFLGFSFVQFKKGPENLTREIILFHHEFFTPGITSGHTLTNAVIYSSIVRLCLLVLSFFLSSSFFPSFFLSFFLSSHFFKIFSSFFSFFFSTAFFFFSFIPFLSLLLSFPSVTRKILFSFLSPRFIYLFFFHYSWIFFPSVSFFLNFDLFIYSFFSFCLYLSSLVHVCFLPFLFCFLLFFPVSFLTQPFSYKI